MINVHTHTKHGKDTEVVNLKLYEDSRNFEYYSVGLHPWDIETQNIEDVMLWMQNLASEKQLLAIGEIGLDRIKGPSLDKQISVFTYQHSFAQALNKPIIVHSVKSYSDLLALHKLLSPTIPWVIHGFTGNLTMAKSFVNKGCYLSFGKALLDSEKIQEVLKNIPLEKIFFETDNSVLKIELLYEKAAKLRHLCTRDLEKVIEQSFKNVFRV